MATPNAIDHIKREGCGNVRALRWTSQYDVILNSSAPGRYGQPYQPFALGKNATPQQLKADIADYGQARMQSYNAFLKRTSSPGVVTAARDVHVVAMSDQERARWGAKMYPSPAMIYHDTAGPVKRAKPLYGATGVSS